MNWMLFAVLLAGCCLVFAAGFVIGSALCSRRWTEKCDHCQTLMGRVRTTRGGSGA